MKRLRLSIVLAIPLLVLVSGTGLAAVQAPHLRIKLTNFEQSKDSHSETRAIEVKGNKVTVSGPDRSTCVRGRCSHKTWTFTLTPEQEKKLWNAVRTQGLMRDFKEENPTTGVGSFVDLTVKIHYGKRQYSGLVTGRKNTLGTDTGMISAAAYRYMSGATSMAFFIERLIPPKAQ